MIKKSFLTARLLLLFTLLCHATARADFPPVEGHAPETERRPKDVTVHDDKRIDDYFWLRNRKDPKVIAHLKAENAWTEKVMKPAEGLRKEVFKEMKSRIKEEDSSVPAPLMGWLYYSRIGKGQQHHVMCRKKDAPGSAEEVLVDINKLAKGHDYTEMEHFAVSHDGSRLLYSMDWTGYRQYEVFVKDLGTGKLVPQKTGKVSGVEWGADNNTLFIVTENEAKRSDKLWRCTLSDGKRELLYEEKDELYDLVLSRSLDYRCLFCESASKKITEVRVLRLDRPGSTFTVLRPREPDHEYHADFREGRYYFLTNKDAKNFRVVSAPAENPSQWTDVIAHEAEIKIEDITLFKTFMAVIERQNGLPYLRLFDFASGKSRRLEMPEPLYDLNPDENLSYEATEFRFSYDSMVTPPSVRAVDAASGAQRTLKQKEVPGYDPTKYESKRLFTTAKDGVAFPLSVVWRKDLDLSKPQPLLLYGYGSYGLSETASFSQARVSLLDRGMIFVTAHIRGGGDLGEDWREAGRMAKKMNTFTDFIAAAESLIKEGWTTSEQLAINGGSAGGLLMGAVINLRPDLFHTAVMDVPFVDVLNTMLDASIPLTTGEYVEWGNPTIKEQYNWMRAYSPYDNIKAAAYPDVLINTGLNDSQVPYWEGAKFAAKLRALRTDKKLTLLHCEMGSGHGGASGRYDHLIEVARSYAFILTSLGIPAKSSK
ncbi:MAG TPA: S9 family peptidase [Verrucomicrobiales bacterium]|nr:S9 family peptidase [Verrucomicrobiales bacterium]